MCSSYQGQNIFDDVERSTLQIVVEAAGLCVSSCSAIDEQYTKYRISVYRMTSTGNQQWSQSWKSAVLATGTRPEAEASTRTTQCHFIREEKVCPPGTPHDVTRVIAVFYGYARSLSSFFTSYGSCSDHSGLSARAAPQAVQEEERQFPIRGRIADNACYYAALVRFQLRPATGESIAPGVLITYLIAPCNAARDTQSFSVSPRYLGIPRSCLSPARSLSRVQFGTSHFIYWRKLAHPLIAWRLAWYEAHRTKDRSRSTPPTAPVRTPPAEAIIHPRYCEIASVHIDVCRAKSFQVTNIKMLFKSNIFVAALGLSSVLAAPAIGHREHPLEDIQCRCLTFRVNELPTPCNFFESRGFGWRSAQTLASQYDIQVQFASKNTISKVLSISTPLPSDVLQATSAGDAQSALGEANSSENKIVCGFGQEVGDMSRDHRDLVSEDRFVGLVIAWLMFFIILYVAGEYVWTRFSSRNRIIKLKGEERPFKSTASKETPSNFT
ncbi:hypothetical protein OPT61_g4282 [Boeremia exigua]|uniref:Uncharacterized protein n=1 Tax=Boeremia exigua TaxID=749465 RepID=A0ACC2IER1_9PLEO|nr:hypothetical protein OPT61_g4282 [Boeremia exigua]